MSFFSAETAIINHLSANFDCPVLGLVEMKDLARVLAPTPAIYVLYDGEQVGATADHLSPDGLDQIDTQYWLVGILVPDLGDPILPARLQAEPYLDQLCAQLCGYFPIDSNPLIRVTGPKPFSLEGKAFFPLRFRLQMANEY